jgi:hypothetical protein
MPAPIFDTHTLQTLRDMELWDADPEFARGAINLAAELDPVIEQPVDERMADYAEALGYDRTRWDR